jgi:lysophospholipase L1-like esterase
VGIGAMGLLAAAGSTAGSAAATSAPAGIPYYVAIGGSDSVGYQPTAAKPNGARTDQGYANDLLQTERARWNGLQLVQLGCPGETTITMIEGDDHCYLPPASQLATTIGFLRQHPSTVLMTVDLGFNDVERCFVRFSINQACVTLAMAHVRNQLPAILAALRAAAGPAVHIIGVGHYDPYVAAYDDGPAAQAFAQESLTVITRLNEVMRAAYDAAGIPMADIASTFGMGDVDPTDPADSAQITHAVGRVCALTWMCSPAPLQPNKHPDDEGYEAIAAVIGSLLPSS